MDKLERTIDGEINHVLDTMSNMKHITEEYEIAAKALKLLCEARSKPAANRLSAETLVTVTANLLGIMLIIKHEQFNVMTSRAMGLIIKPK